MPVHSPCPFSPTTGSGAPLLADLGISSGAICIDFSPELVAVDRVELRNLTTGSLSRNFFGYEAGWFYMHFSGAAGNWEIKVYTMDGTCYSGTFYCSGSIGGNPGDGDEYDNAY